MRGMESRNAHARRSLRLAFAVSLLLHAAVLFIGFSRPAPTSGPEGAAGTARSRLLVTLVRPATPAPRLPPSAPRRAATPVIALGKRAGSPAQRTEQPKLSAPAGAWSAPSWSGAERADMDKFLDGLGTQPPASLSQRALAMARQLGRTPQDEGGDEAPGQTRAEGKAVEPLSVELYFDAFIGKLNRSAAFVRNAPTARGFHKALVQITLNADGSLQRYRVLRAADQEAEIAYIKRVLDRASPFSAFPPDIRKARDTLSILMCIYPAQAGRYGGFSRSFDPQQCRD
ncbi:MAG TPA: hypothetical protein VMV91_05785 [Rhodocyclaceae bacterium]|nr:hypothetical protein [Rhodocyclaceae bacterium]